MEVAIRYIRAKHLNILMDNELNYYLNLAIFQARDGDKLSRFVY